MKLRTQISLAFGTILAIFITTMLVFNTFFAKDYYMDVKKKQMEQIFTSISTHYQGDIIELHDLLKEYENRDGVNIVIIDEGRLVYTTFSRDVKQNLSLDQKKDYLNRFDKIPPTHTKADLEVVGRMSNSIHDAYLSITLPSSAIDSSMVIFSGATMICLSITVVIALVVAYLLSKKITKPIQQIEEITTQFSNLNFKEKMDENSNIEEFNKVAATMNELSRQLESTIQELHIANHQLHQDIEYQRKLEKTNKELIANISHEMKTPIALLQLYASALNDPTQKVDTKYYLDTIMEETMVLDDMLKVMLTTAKMQNGTINIYKQHTNISTLCNNLLTKVQPLLQNNSIRINIQSDIYALVDENLLTQAMKNYLTNAIEYGTPGGWITIQLHQKDSKIVFTVENQGVSIEESKMEDLWNSFYRIDESRNRQGKNIGMGLYIVKTIIEKHQGTLGVKNIPDGVSFWFEIKSV